jgi:MFS family permease
MTSPTARVAARQSLNPFRLVAENRNFRLFWLGQTTSLVGTWMQGMAQGWLALELSDNAFLVGLVAAVGALPILLLSLPAGVLVDRTNRLTLLIAAQSLLLAEATLLWWFTVSGQITIGVLLALVTVAGIVSAVEIPTRLALVVELVGRDDLHDAIALNSSGFNLARIVGPALAAVVTSARGLAWCFGVNALSFLAVLGGLALVKLPARPRAEHVGSPLDGLRELFRFVRATREVSALMQLVTVFSVFGIPYLTLMPVVARDRLGLGASGYGLLLTFVGVGGLAGALLLASLGRRMPRGRLLVASSLAFPVLLGLFALTRAPALARPLLLGVGLLMIINSALANGLLQSLAPEAMRGRLMSAYSLIVVGLAQVAGSFVAGAVARAAGPQWAIGGGAVVMLVFAAFAALRYPEVRRM